jgi:hypothetical protein
MTPLSRITLPGSPGPSFAELLADTLAEEDAE